MLDAALLFDSAENGETEDPNVTSLRYELSHDTIARQVFGKASAESQERRKREKYVRDKHAMSLEGGGLLTKDDFEYLNPYLSAVRLSPEESEFVDRSRRHLRLKTIRLVSAIVGVIVILAGLSVWAALERVQAVDARIAAEEATNASLEREMQAAAIAISVIEERDAREALGRLEAVSAQAAAAARERAASADATMRQRLLAFDRGVPLQLGSVDSASAYVLSDPEAYFRRLHREGMPARFHGEGQDEYFSLRRGEGDGVAAFQAFLEEVGFLPDADIDGIFDYRTHAAARLWYEYIRTVAPDTAVSVGVPDGAFGLSARYQTLRWRRDRLRAWDGASGQNPTDDHRAWLSALESIKAHYLAEPSPHMEHVVSFAGPTDSRAVADWDFDPERTHLIGIRRNIVPMDEVRFDDVFVLLVDGVTFKFFGTTQAGSTYHEEGAPLLLPGQHDYRRGWHQGRYRALRPAMVGAGGPLTFRDGDADGRLSESELGRGAEPNPTINIHWGGTGLGGRQVRSWSGGAQAIVGGSYINHRDERVDYSGSALNRSRLGRSEGGEFAHKGGYSVLIDLIWALSASDEVLYTVIEEDDLRLAPDLDPDVAADIYERLLGDTQVP